MALIAFASAKGSPGVSVTVAGLSRLWPGRAVVADLDPAGGDTGLRYRTENGDPLNPSTGLLSLGAAVRSGQTAALEDHLQTTAGGMRTLVGVTTPGQVLGLGPAWKHIALTLRRAREYDVLADCGRLTPGRPRWRSSTRPTRSSWSAGASSRTSPTCASACADSRARCTSARSTPRRPASRWSRRPATAAASPTPSS